MIAEKERIEICIFMKICMDLLLIGREGLNFVGVGVWGVEVEQMG